MVHINIILLIKVIFSHEFSKEYSSLHNSTKIEPGYKINAKFVFI